MSLLICAAMWRGFLDHWRPDLALFVESELWPNLLLEAQRRAVPLALVNARLSSRSHFEGWRRAPDWHGGCFRRFDFCLAQDETIARRISALGAHDVRITGNLKADAPSLPVDESALSALRKAIGERSVFLAASTHDGEEAAVFDAAHAANKSGALTIIVPRHDDRGAAVQSVVTAAALRRAGATRRSLPGPDTDVYIADTMGELGLFYSVAQVAFLGGSLIPHGGQNPLEAARFSVPVLAGPHTGNLPRTLPCDFRGQGAGRVSSGQELAMHCGGSGGRSRARAASGPACKISGGCAWRRAGADTRSRRTAAGACARLNSGCAMHRLGANTRPCCRHWPPYMAHRFACERLAPANTARMHG